MKTQFVSVSSVYEVFFDDGNTCCLVLNARNAEEAIAVAKSQHTGMVVRSVTFMGDEKEQPHQIDFGFGTHLVVVIDEPTEAQQP